MIRQTHTDTQVWTLRCEVQPALLSQRVTLTLFSFITRSCRGRTWMARQPCTEGFFTNGVLRHLAPCGSWGCSGGDHELFFLCIQCVQVYGQFMWLDST